MFEFILFAGVILTFFIAAFLLIFSSGSSSHVTKSGPVIFFGDSLTAGVGAGVGEDFPTLVAKHLAIDDFINAGSPGETSGHGLTRLEKDVLSKNPSLVVVEFSGNDFLQEVAVEETIRNIEEITYRIKKTGAQAVLVHIRFPFYAKQYEDGFKKIEKEYHVKVVWNSLDRIMSRSSLMSDIVHPNSAGYKIMAERVAKVLARIVNPHLFRKMVWK